MSPSKRRSAPAAKSAPSSPPIPALRDLIGYRIRKLNTLLTQHSKVQNSKTLGLTLAEVRVLYEIGASGTSPARAVAEAAGLERSHVTQATRELVKRKLILKSADPEDGRGVLLSLTDRGKATLNHGLAASAERRARLQAALSKEDWSAFHSALDKLTVVAEQLLEELRESESDN